MYKIFRWLISFDSKTRLISIAILLVSIMMSSIIFASMDTLQLELIHAYSRFSRDFSTILSHHVVLLIQKANIVELKNFIEQLYLSTSSIQYVKIFDTAGNLLFSFPFDSTQFQQEFAINHIDRLISSIHNFFLIHQSQIV